MTTDRHDVLVIGGGFAGVTAARDLQKRGIDTLLLEARDRLGGRTWTEERHGWQVELGGTWIHWSQPFVWSEVQRYGLEVVETLGASSDRIVLMLDGRPHELSGAEIGELLEGFEAFFEEALEIWERPYDAHHRWLDLAERDSLSVADRLDALELSPLQTTAVGAYLETLSMCPLDSASYVEMMRVWALAGGTFPLFSDSLARYKLARGTRSLLESIADDGGFRIGLDSSVTAIHQTETGVRVDTASGETHEASAAVVAVPLNVLHEVRFDPALSEPKARASREKHAGQGFKAFLEIEGDPGLFLTLARREDGPLGTCFPFHQGEDRSLLVAFGTDARALVDLDVASWQRALDGLVPGLRVLRVFGHEWADDPWAQGTWCSLKKGQTTAYADELVRHEGRLVFAGGDLCAGWRGFIDGAIGSGARAAVAVADLLSD